MDEIGKMLGGSGGPGVLATSPVPSAAVGGEAASRAPVNQLGKAGLATR
jgi:hypothetical protein